MALDDDQPLSGAQFIRQVGADPEKWAGRFLDAWAAAPIEVGTRRGELEFVTSWFRDAMEAAAKVAEPPSVDWDKLRDRLNVTLSEHGLPGLRKPSE